MTTIIDRTAGWESKFFSNASEHGSAGVMTSPVPYRRTMAGGSHVCSWEA
ncbi:hypothetical protein [Herbidospora cretacea]|nr:hypothetical protein [Herbidospora cretacea]